MTHKKTPFILIMTLFALPLLYACNGGSDNESAIVEPADTENADTIANNPEDTVEPTGPNESIDYSEQNESVDVKEPREQKKASTPTYGGKETLYISTYGANGKVWGHVTMNGKTGRGTIHDDDENTYSITVTRHGGELFGIDQNGREYVFRL